MGIKDELDLLYDFFLRPALLMHEEKEKKKYNLRCSGLGMLLGEIREVDRKPRV